MRAVVIPRAGGYERLVIEHRPDPTPGPGEVAIDVRAIGVNYADCVVRMGLYQSAKDYVGWPITPGFEVAGDVLAVGPGVGDLAPGDPVIGVTRFGGYATRLVVPRARVFRLPPLLDAAQAAAFPAVSLTAYFALFELAHPHAGDDVLVHSAAGGVGSVLVQLAKAAGCRVVGVVGQSHKVSFVRTLGADVVIDKSREDLWRAAKAAAPGGYAVILDANGAETLRHSYDHLGRPGKLVVYGFHTMLPRKGGKPDLVRLALGWLKTPRFDPLAMTSENRSVLAFNLSYLFEKSGVLEEGMSRLFAWLDEGRLRPPAVTRYRFDDVADAHRDLESGATTGKLVLIP